MRPSFARVASVLLVLFGSFGTVETLLAHPQTAPDPALPPGTAESLSGAELWRWRERMHEASEHGRPEELAAVVAALVGDDPSAHYRRAAIALEAARLRSKDVETRRAFPSALIEIVLPDRPPLEPRRFVEWVRERAPYVDAGLLVQCASRALARGRTQEAAEWYLCAIEATPVTEETFFSVVHGIVQAAQRGETTSFELQGVLEELTGASWPSLQEAAWLEERLAVLAGYSDPSAVETACTELASRCSGDRMVLALEERRSNLGRVGRLRPPAELLSERSELLDLAVHPLDRAALLQRAASVSLLTEGNRSRGLDMLERALAIAPPSARAQRIHGDLLVQHARAGSPDEEFLAAVELAFTRHVHYWEGVLPSLDVAFELLADQGRDALLLRCCESLQRVLPADHAFLGRVHLERARLAKDPEEAQTCLEKCAAVKTLCVRFTDPPQTTALRQLAAIHERRGEFVEAADLLAQVLTLTPPPEPYDPEGFEDLAHWLELRIGTESLDSLFADLVAAVDDGEALGRNQEDRILARLLRPFVETFGAEKTARRVVEQRALREAQGAQQEVLDFFSRMAEVASFDPRLLDRIELALDEAQNPTDAKIYRVASEALERASVTLAVRVLSRARDRLSRDGGERFSTEIPEPLARALRERLEQMPPNFEVETIAAVLGPHPSAENREALLRAVAIPDSAARPALLDALRRQPKADALPLSDVEQAATQVLLEDLAGGELRTLELCLSLDEAATGAAVEQWCVQANSRVQRMAAMRALSLSAPTIAARVLAGLARRPEPELQYAALELCARLAGDLDVEERLSVVRPGLESPDEELRLLALAAIHAERLLAPPEETSRVLRLLADPSARVRAAAEDCLDQLEGPDALRELVAELLRVPDLLEQDGVRRALSRLSPEPLPDLSTTGPERERALRALLEPSPGR